MGAAEDTSPAVTPAAAWSAEPITHSGAWVLSAITLPTDRIQKRNRQHDEAVRHRRLTGAQTASAIRTMFVVDRVTVHAIKDTLDRTDRVGMWSPNTPMGSRSCGCRSSRTPVYRRAEE
ncbi:MAG: hypothetical protein K0S81_4066 [Rhodospirillales bacterium]|nr:hypothetical protein [Rhodospirillales bacterium]